MSFLSAAPCPLSGGFLYAGFFVGEEVCLADLSEAIAVVLQQAAMAAAMILFDLLGKSKVRVAAAGNAVFQAFVLPHLLCVYRVTVCFCGQTIFVSRRGFFLKKKKQRCL
jgi:hypothetical protein